MVCTLPSTRSLSKASREGDLRENMATADISASGKAISVSSVRASGMLAKPFRTKRKSASAERCLRPLGATIDIAPPHVKAVHRVSVRGILSHGGLRKDNPDIKVITGFYRSPGIAGCCSTRPATAKSIPPEVRRVYRIRSQGCLERLEPDIRKRICPVLRGGGDGTVASLPDTMKLTVLEQYGKGLVQCEGVLGEEICNKIERLKWSLWHGQVDKALGKIDELGTSIEPFTETYARFPRLVKALSELRTYIVNNRHVIPNYGERYHNGEAIATGFVESTVNEVVSKRFCKKQQMQWSKEGAHLLLQTRVRTLNGELGAIFKRWYPDMDLEVEEIPVAA